MKLKEAYEKADKGQTVTQTCGVGYFVKTGNFQYDTEWIYKTGAAYQLINSDEWEVVIIMNKQIMNLD